MCANPPANHATPIIAASILKLTIYALRMKRFLTTLYLYLFLSLSHTTVSQEESQFESPPLTPEKILELIEQAYPNPVSPDDLAK